MNSVPSNVAPLEALTSGRPELIDILSAAEVCPELGEGGLLHAGPPLGDRSPVGPMEGAIEGAILYETSIPGNSLYTDRKPTLLPCNEVGFVGPLAGVVSAHMPVWVVRNATTGTVAYSTLNEGLGKVLRFGANGPEVIERLHWMEHVLAPALRRALTIHGPVDLLGLMSEALRRGDELHNRNKAATSAIARELAPEIAAGDHATEVLGFIRDNDHFFLNISIAAAKCIADAAARTNIGSIVTAMASNGHEFGIRMSGTGEKWFTAPAPKAAAKYFEGYEAADACNVLGDSFIAEVVGLGGFALAAAPGIASFVGGIPSELASMNERMYAIAGAEHPTFRIPALDFRGVPTGIDAKKVLTTQVLPALNAGVAHKNAGFGQVGAGIVQAPLECFEKAVRKLNRNVNL